MTAKFKLGATLVDTVTNFSGTVVAITFYIDGSIQYCIQPQLSLDGSFRQAEWFRETTLQSYTPKPSTLGFQAEVQE